MICINEEVPDLTTGPGVKRKVLASGGGMMAVQFSFEKGSVGALHSHPHEQIGYVAKGRFELTLDGVPTILGVGDTYYVPSGVVHGVKVLEDGVLLDVFTPQREDFLPR